MEKQKLKGQYLLVLKSILNLEDAYIYQTKKKKRDLGELVNYKFHGQTISSDQVINTINNVLTNYKGIIAIAENTTIFKINGPEDSSIDIFY